MKKVAVAVLAAALWTSGAWAQGDDDFRDWRVAAVAPDKTSAHLVDTISIRKAGAALIVDVLTIYAAPRAMGPTSYDRTVTTLLVDCASKNYRFQNRDYRLGKQRPPPPLTRDPDSFPAPPEGSATAQLLQAACGDVTMTSEQIENPDQWARTQLGK